jgi:hypothetical protein
MPSNSANVCPVCGYPGLAEPPYDQHGCASFEICPSCGTEFGYDDATRTPDQLRQQWVQAGARSSSKTTPAPSGWDGAKQLQTAGLAPCSPTHSTQS